MVTEVYDALIEEKRAKKKRGKRRTSLLTMIWADYDLEFADIGSELKLMKWMLGAIFTSVVTLIFHAFGH
jgi:hypothetical protein